MGWGLLADVELDFDHLCGGAGRRRHADPVGREPHAQKGTHHLIGIALGDIAVEGDLGGPAGLWCDGDQIEGGIGPPRQHLAHRLGKKPSELSAEEVDRIRLRGISICTLVAVWLVAVCLGAILTTSAPVNAEKPSQSGRQKTWNGRLHCDSVDSQFCFRALLHRLDRQAETKEGFR